MLARKKATEQSSNAPEMKLLSSPSFATRKRNMKPVHRKVKRDSRWKLTHNDKGKVVDQYGDVWTPAQKAYKNPNFLASRRARLLRIMAEYEETEHRLEELDVHHTILVFCSARGRSREQWELQRIAAVEKVKNAKTNEDKEAAEANQLRVTRLEWLCEYYDKTLNLTRRLAEWSLKQPISFIINTGGGPGLMEAANKGASDAGAKTMGMGISLPFEPGLNKYVSNELAFEYHYFFTRKFWMSYPARALVVSPGGFGTVDELFEILTLQQTGKMPRTPIVCLGKQFWKDVLNIDAMVKYGTVSPKDADRIFFTDSIDEAFTYLTEKLEAFVEQEIEDGSLLTSNLEIKMSTQTMTDV